MLNEYSLYDEQIMALQRKERLNKYDEAERIFRMTAMLNRKKAVITNILEGTGHFLINSGNKLLDIA